MKDGKVRRGSDLELPFLFVPQGGEPPPEWLARHPGAVRFPAKFQPHASAAANETGSTQGPDAALLGASEQVPPGASDGGGTRSDALAAGRAGRPLPPDLSISEDPIRTYLGVNRQARWVPSFRGFPSPKETGQ